MRKSPAAEPARAELLLRGLPWLACLFGVWPLLRGGFPNGHDVLYELVRISEYREAFAAGQWPPFWSEHLYAGYGSPVFLFYAPLFSAAASLAASLAGSVEGGATWLLVAISVVSVPLARGFLAALLEATGLPDSAAARLGTVFFVVHPYLLGDKLVRNADAEFMGLCLTPLALHGVAIAARDPRRGAALVSAGLALVVLAHNLTALVAVAFVLGLGVVLHGVRARAAWLAIGAGIAAALALTAFFWLPALALQDLIRPEELLLGKFDYRRQFPPLEKIFWYVRFFATGLAHPRGAGRGRRGGRAVPGAATHSGVAHRRGARLLFLETPASAWLWERIPWLPLFQFPWRMMGPLALVASALAALLAALALAGRTPRARALAEVGFTVVALANAWPLVAQYAPLTADEARTLDRVLHPEQIRNSAETVTAGDEYLPRASDRTVWYAQRPIARAGGRGERPRALGDAAQRRHPHRARDARADAGSAAAGPLRLSGLAGRDRRRARGVDAQPLGDARAGRARGRRAGRGVARAAAAAPRGAVDLGRGARRVGRGARRLVAALAAARRRARASVASRE